MSEQEEWYSPIQQRYNEDEMCIAKTAQMLSVFPTRSDYPYCGALASGVCELLLGVDLTVLAAHTPTQAGIESLPPADDNFERELRAFLVSFDLMFRDMNAGVIAAGTDGLVGITYQIIEDKACVRLMTGYEGRFDIAISKDQSDIVLATFSGIVNQLADANKS